MTFIIGFCLYSILGQVVGALQQRLWPLECAALDGVRTVTHDWSRARLINAIFNVGCVNPFDQGVGIVATGEVGLFQVRKVNGRLAEQHGGERLSYVGN